MEIIFSKLQNDHFPLLLKWLESQHVKQWWDKGVIYTEELIKEKYTPYVMVYKILKSIKKPMHAYVIFVDNNPMGYIQYYNKYDFPPEKGYNIENLPSSLAAIDFYIGEKNYLGKGLSAKILKDFLKLYVFEEFKSCFVDPDTANKTAIRSYKNVGFKIAQEIPELNATWMLIHKKGGV